MKGNELSPHIGIFGRRNYGKSALFNFLTGQSIAIVSSTPGTTTDPVRKAMELSGVGPVIWVDTAGIDDDQASLGPQRIQRSFQILDQVDLAIILFSNNHFDAEEVSLLARCQSNNIPFLLIYSKIDLLPPDPDLIDRIQSDYDTSVFLLSVRRPDLRDPLLARIRQSLPDSAFLHPSLLADVISPADTVLLVTPIDSSAPEGRLILPQVQVIRDILDNHASAVVCRESELPSTLASLLAPPRLVVTDSQVFNLVAPLVPDSVYLTSFSVLLARSKGLFSLYLDGTPAISSLSPHSRVLLLESCTHNVSCDDIGRVKIPALLRRFTGFDISCDVVAGLTLPNRPLSDYHLVIQCGGCLLTPRQLASRLQPAIQAHVPVTNYGLAIAYMNGIFHRAIRIFSDNTQSL